MPLSLRIMSLIGIVVTMAGLPALLRPIAVRATFGLRDTPHMAYVLRIVGTMLVALGAILIVFALSYWKAAA